jgi:putative membrane protein
MEQTTNTTGRKEPDLREYLAAERTFLAYIRTSLGLMGFGFVIARFALFLREVQLFQGSSAPPSTPGLSVWFGTAFVLFGVVLNAMSIVEYRAVIRRLNVTHGASVPPAATPVATAVVIGACGAAMSVYLLWLK